MNIEDSPNLGGAASVGDVLIMSQCVAQWPRVELPRLIHPDELARTARALRKAGRTGAQVSARVLAAAGFAAAMWLLLAGPGFMDGPSSTVDRAAQRTAMRMVR